MDIIAAVPYSQGWVVDVYVPDRPMGSAPVIACVGAPGFHDHPGNVRLAKVIAEQGPAIVLSPQYELGYVAAAFGALEKFITQRCAEFGGDGRRVTVVGISSGAGPAAVWAFSDGLTVSPPIVHSYVGAGGLYAAFLAPLIGKHLSLRVRLVHGEQDASAPADSAARVEKALKDAGYDSDLRIRPGAHADTYDPDHPLGRLTIATILDTAGALE